MRHDCAAPFRFLRRRRAAFLLAVLAALSLRVRDWKTGEIYAELPAHVGDALFFGWVHSLEKIPWNEYYHIDPDLNLVLDTITFPAFGAGIPENKGRVCRVENGLIYMEEIGQVFGELVWLNSPTATRDIRLNGTLLASGSSLPGRVRLRLKVEQGSSGPTGSQAITGSQTPTGSQAIKE